MFSYLPEFLAASRVEGSARETHAGGPVVKSLLLGYKTLVVSIPMSLV